MRQFIELDRLLDSARLPVGDHLEANIGQVYGRTAQIQQASLQTSDVEQVIDQTRHPVHVRCR